jgi:DNA-binding response OmpR family regulator
VSVKRVLVVDDEADTRALIWDVLSQEGYDVHLCSNGVQAVEKLEKERFHLVVTDIKMPGMSGIELLLRARSIAPDTRVILMTAYASLDTAIQALRGQAFDYLIKPFDLDDLRQRVRQAVQGQGRPTVSHYRDLTIDREGRWVWVGDQKTSLTRLEFEILAYFFEHVGRAVSNEDLLREVWQCDETDERSLATVKSCISRLRKKLKEDADNPRYVFNVWGVGYRFGE